MTSTNHRRGLNCPPLSPIRRIPPWILNKCPLRGSSGRQPSKFSRPTCPLCASPPGSVESVSSPVAYSEKSAARIHWACTTYPVGWSSVESWTRNSPADLSPTTGLNRAKKVRFAHALPRPNVQFPADNYRATIGPQLSGIGPEVVLDSPYISVLILMSWSYFDGAV